MPVFLAHITDTDPEVRTAMIESLGALGARGAVAAIEALAEIDAR